MQANPTPALPRRKRGQNGAVFGICSLFAGNGGERAAFVPAVASARWGKPHPTTMVFYSHPPKASYGVAPLRRTNAYCLQRRALSETFGGWLYIQGSGEDVCREFTIQVQQLQKKASISDTAKNIKTLQETANGYLPSYYAL